MLKTSVDLYKRLIKDGMLKEAENLVKRRPQVLEVIEAEKTQKAEIDKKEEKRKK